MSRTKQDRPEWKPSLLKTDTLETERNNLVREPIQRKNLSNNFHDTAQGFKNYVKKKLYYSRRAKNFDQDQDTIDEIPRQSILDTAAIICKDTQGNTTTLNPNPQFKQYKHNFKEFLRQNCVVTPFSVIYMIINYDSTRVVVVMKKNEQTSIVHMYSLKNFDLLFEEYFSGECIKMHLVEQNSVGNHFAAAYMDDGLFRVRTFGYNNRTQEEIEQEELKVNEMFGLNNFSMAITDFPDPFITICFIAEDKLFVDFFYSYSQIHYHFIWDFKARQIVGQPISLHMDCNQRNFPVKCFYSQDRDEVYSFYRQGQSFKMNCQDIENYRYYQVYDGDMGQIELIDQKCLVVQSSGKIRFFLEQEDPLTQEEIWTCVHTIKIRGSIYYIKDTNRIQVTTMNYVYFYIIDLNTYEPNLENVMNNFMGCSQMMIGKKQRNCIAYKVNQRSFDIFQRKYMHNLRVCVNDSDFSGSQAVEFITMNMIVVTFVNKLILFEDKTFQKIGEIQIPLLPTETREVNEIIGIRKSQCENLMAIISGKNLIMDEQKQNQLFIFKRRLYGVAGVNDSLFELHKRIILKDIPIFDRVCMQFLFKLPKDGKDPSVLIFAKKTQIFEMNFEKETIKIIYQYSMPFTVQPNYFVSNDTQDIFVVASMHDGFWVNLKDRNDVDLDELYNIDSITQIVFDNEDKIFYFLANKKNGFIGFYLIKFDENNPGSYQFITMWKTLLDIGDCTIAIQRGVDCNGEFKELIIGYKTININTYNIFVQDLSGSSKTRSTLARHESFQLWESKVSGLLITHSKDFLTFSKAGINLVALGTLDRKSLVDAEGQLKMIHSLDSLSFLKVEGINMINFCCQDYNNRIVSIEQEWRKNVNTDQQSTHYSEIYKLKIHEITLRELLILQSFYLSKNDSQVLALVKIQPNPQFFYKTFLELDCSNMASILSFDSGSMSVLLSEDNQQFFSELYPIIYKNKILKKNNEGFYYTNAIDIALKNNQVRAVSLLMDYIIKFQNNYISSYLFTKNMPVIIEKGINISAILESKVFTVPFDFDEWPQTHYNDEFVIKPYNGSYFHLRFAYNKVFREENFRSLEDIFQDPDKSFDFDSTKIKKIKYTINLLLQTSMYIQEPSKGNGPIEVLNEDISLMQLCSDTEELEMFNTEAIQNIVEYKWTMYGRKHHFLGMAMHMFYTCMLTIYVSEAYLKETSYQQSITIALAFGVIYPAYYDFSQLYRIGITTYFSDLGNYSDCIYIWASIINVILQNTLGPYHIICRSIMIIIVLQVLLKTFFFLRVFPSLTPVIVMLKTVIYDLRIFMLFYSILIGLFCQVFAVLGLGNQAMEEMQETRRRRLVPLLRILKAKGGGGGGSDFIDDDGLSTSLLDGPAKEYNSLGLHMGEFMWTLRLSIGDGSAIEASKHLKIGENRLFWVMWLIVTIVTCVIFLNFIVAEASASYTKVTETLEQVIWQEKSSLIVESEEMANEKKKTPEQYPKYIICRQVEE